MSFSQPQWAGIPREPWKLIVHMLGLNEAIGDGLRVWTVTPIELKNMWTDAKNFWKLNYKQLISLWDHQTGRQCRQLWPNNRLLHVVRYTRLSIDGKTLYNIEWCYELQVFSESYFVFICLKTRECVQRISASDKCKFYRSFANVSNIIDFLWHIF